LWTLVLALTASCGGLISESDFTKLVAAKLAELDPKLKVTVAGPLEVDYSNEKTEKPFKSYLNNAYQQYKNGEDLSAIVEKYAKSSIQTLVTVKPDLNNIVPVVKDSNYIKEVTASLKAQGASSQQIDFYSVPYAEGLVIMYAVDTPENIRYIGRTDFEKLGTPEAELRKKAIQNLNQILPQAEVHMGENVDMVTAGGNYESSLLLFDKLWSGLQDKVAGNIVVAIPSRDILLVTGSHNRKGIAELKGKVEEVMTSGAYTLTKTLYERKDQGWVRFAD
jgi:uncharacterized protein YtpQ (UPF0354 family)